MNHPNGRRPILFKPVTDEQRIDYERRKEQKMHKDLEDAAREMKHNRAMKRIEDSGLAPVLERYTFEKYEIKEPWQRGAFEIARGYAADPKGWLLLAGQSGAGKTHLCTAVAGFFLKAGHDVYYLLWRQSYTTISGFDARAEKERDRIRSAEILYIDDFLKEEPITQELKIAFDLIDARYRTQKLTIISTERLPGDLKKIDGAMWGRIKEMSAEHSIIISRNE